MTAQMGTDLYRRGLELAEAGKYQEALNCIQEHLRMEPDDAPALNDAGTILHCLGRSKDAIPYLMKARSLQPDSGEIVWNLVETYLGGGQAGEAVLLLDTMERMGILNIDVLNRTATMLLDQCRKGQAVEVLLRSQRLWPEQKVIAPMLDVIRSKRPKVAFFRCGTGDGGSLAETCAFVERRFQMEFWEDQTLEGMTQLLHWSDIAWFDGGGEMVVEASRTPHAGKIILSLRRSDVRDDWVKQVCWESVDILMQMGSPAVEHALLEHVPDIRNRTRLVVIPNGVNLDRCSFQQRQRGKHLACMGWLSMEANPAFLLQCMQKLHYVDSDYRLSFAGRFESPVLEQYVRHMVQTLGLVDVVSFTSYPGDLNAWLADKHFIVSSGIGEDQLETLLIGMAGGLKPVVHNFPGAQMLFPPECLFNISEEFCEQVIGREYDPAKYRRFVEDRYPVVRQLEQVNGILTQLETEIDLRQFSEGGRGAAPVFRAPVFRENGLPAPRPADVANLR